MAHTIHEKKKIVSRVNRIQGQLSAVAKAVETEVECYQVIQLLSSVRGALNGLMSEVLEGHIAGHIVEADTKKDASRAGKELVEIMRSFWK